MHPRLTQVPPRRPGSTSATRAPSCAARCATARPPLPPPIAMRSYCRSMFPPRRVAAYYSAWQPGAAGRAGAALAARTACAPPLRVRPDPPTATSVLSHEPDRSESIARDARATAVFRDPRRGCRARHRRRARAQPRRAERRHRRRRRAQRVGRDPAARGAAPSAGARLVAGEPSQRRDEQRRAARRVQRLFAEAVRLSHRPGPERRPVSRLCRDRRRIHR